MNQRVLVTGGSGFLGINLIRHLRSKGITDIRSIDLVPFDYPEKEHIQAAVGDIRDVAALKQVMQGVTWVIHTAAALPLYSEQDIMTTDVDGTRNVMAAARAAGVKRAVMISSTAVYGIPDHHPLFETDRLIGVGPYGRAKILAEEECLKARGQGLCVPIIRPKSFVGPERLGVFALFYDWAYTGHGFPMIGSGRNRYQLLDVEDLCEAIWLTLTLDSAKVNDTFNIGAKVFTTMREDYQAVLDQPGKRRGFPAPNVWVVFSICHLTALNGCMGFLRGRPNRIDTLLGSAPQHSKNAVPNLNALSFKRIRSISVARTFRFTACPGYPLEASADKRSPLACLRCSITRRVPNYLLRADTGAHTSRALWRAIVMTRRLTYRITRPWFSPLHRSASRWPDAI